MKGVILSRLLLIKIEFRNVSRMSCSALVTAPRACLANRNYFLENFLRFFDRFLLHHVRCSDNSSTDVPLIKIDIAAARRYAVEGVRRRLSLTATTFMRERTFFPFFVAALAHIHTRAQ